MHDLDFEPNAQIDDCLKVSVRYAGRQNACITELCATVTRFDFSNPVCPSVTSS